MSVGLLAGIKTFFTTASVGVKVAVVAGGVAVVAGAVVAPIAIVTNNAMNDDANHSIVNGEVVKDEKLDPIWNDEEVKWCYDARQYQVNNNGKAPVGTTRTEIDDRCSGDKGKDPRPNYSSETLGGALRVAYMAKYNPNNNSISTEDRLAQPWITPEEKAWHEASQQAEQICQGNNMMSQACRDAQQRISEAMSTYLALLPNIYLPDEEWVTEEMKAVCSYNEKGLWKFWTCSEYPD